jgi:glyceraldehyde 3-phosphate dehydrogenase
MPHKELELVAVNDLTSSDMLGYLLAHDSVHGLYPGTVEVDGDDLVVDGERIKVLSERNPADLPWKEMKVDYVFEATGLFREAATARAHIEAGARRVVITAPGKNLDDATFVMGVNHTSYDPDRHDIVSNASCTTNCLAPVARVINQLVGIKHGWLTTTHAYTNGQRILDVQHKDMRRTRAAAVNIIPTSTGAAKAIGLVIPELDGKLHGAALRVPVPDGSICDLTFVTEKPSSAGQLREAFVNAANGELKGILRATDEPLVSSDIIGEKHSAVVDLDLITQVAPDFFRVVAWYDNENSYSVRCVDLLAYMVGKD